LLAIRHQISDAPQAIPLLIFIGQFQYILELTAFLLRLGLRSLMAIQVTTRGPSAVAGSLGQGRQRLASRQEKANPQPEHAPARPARIGEDLPESERP
jgi:hypothetical protein